MSVEVVHLHKVDGDPRKMVAVRYLVRQYPEVIAYWRKSGITERVAVPDNQFGAKKHKHGALAHMFCEAIYASEFCRWLGIDSTPLEIAALVHDADKPRDMALVAIALGNETVVNWENVELLIEKAELTNKKLVQKELERDCRKYFDPFVNIGDRIHVARSLIGSRLHREELLQFGFSLLVVEIQSATEYSACDIVDNLIDLYDTLPVPDQTLALKKIIMAYIDICMRESELVTPQIRVESLSINPIHVAMSNAYSNWNNRMETGYDKQVRVGNNIQNFLSKLVGIKSDSFQTELQTRVQARISSV